MNEIKKINKTAFISKKNSDKNFGASNQMYVYSKDDDIFRSMFRFSVDQDLIDKNNNPNYLINMKLYISVNRPMDDSFSIKAYPITKDWEEGFGNTHNDITDGVNWITTGNVNWSVEGGDYDNTDEYNVTINGEYQFVEVDLSNYISRVEDLGENFGIILVSENESMDNAYKFAMYSDDSPSGYDPIIQILHDDYEINTENTDLYDGEYPIIIDMYNYKFCHESDEFFFGQINIKPRYSRNNLFCPVNRLKYLPNIQFRLVDETRDKLIYDYSNYTRIPVKEKGMLLTLPTNNLNQGNYYFLLKYTHSDGTVYFSNRIYFTIN